MNRQYKALYLCTLFTLSNTAATHVLAMEEDSLNLNVAPVMIKELDQARGLGGIVGIASNADLDAILTDNSASNNVTGSNSISQGSFSEAGGVFSIIQNTGNNVIIQDSTIITITILPN